MHSHPINLGLRFILELAALGAIGYWGWHTGAGSGRFVLAVGLPVIAAALWGTFRVPNDPGAAPVAIPGLLRLLLEAAFFGFAVWGLFNAGASKSSGLLGLVIIIHYAVSYDRILWLVRQ